MTSQALVYFLFRKTTTGFGVNHSKKQTTAEVKRGLNNQYSKENINYNQFVNIFK